MKLKADAHQLCSSSKKWDSFCIRDGYHFIGSEKEHREKSMHIMKITKEIIKITRHII
jgi:hypothetical protein